MNEILQQKLFEWLCKKYVQQADERQKAMGLQYTTAETHDLAAAIIRFFEREVGIAAMRKSMSP